MTIKTPIGYTTRDDIFVRDRNLATDIIGKLDFIDMIFLAATGELPTLPLKRMSNALMVAVTDHGLTPSAIATRLTFLGAPESIQGAVAAGLLGAGNHFLGTMQLSAQLLQDCVAILAADADDREFDACANALVREHRGSRRIVPGIGHPIHINGDPRVPALRQLAIECGFSGRHWRLAGAIERAAQAEYGKLLPLNAAGAVGASISDMGLEPLWARGFALIGRSAGLVAHLIDEKRAPLGQKLWDLVLAQDDSAELAGHDNPIPQRVRWKHANQP
ncbi:citryl-CoA lyase [Piscinibacter sakaiensis]|uniref:citryl-CoA lyase n=1 Tax=Piscinibacter sakaiensis TaxID=1547922 RepID=UPI003AAB94A8